MPPAHASHLLLPDPLGSLLTWLLACRNRRRLCVYYHTVRGESGSECASYTNDGEWHRFMLVVDGPVLQIHVDDAILHTAVISGPVGDVDGILFLGQRAPGAFRFAGTLALARLYFTALLNNPAPAPPVL